MQTRNFKRKNQIYKTILQITKPTKKITTSPYRYLKIINSQHQ